MKKTRTSWVQREAAKHVTPASIRERIAHEQDKLLVLDSVGLGESRTQARNVHAELIRVLSQRLARLDRVAAIRGSSSSGLWAMFIDRRND